MVAHLERIYFEKKDSPQSHRGHREEE